jgi:Zn-dependent M16 (insulinase) family peptidase
LLISTQIIEETKTLKEAQLGEDSPEAKATLPRLSLGDIDKKTTEIPIEMQEISGVKVLTHPLQTSGILYADLAFDFSGIDLEDLPLLPLFSRMISEAGTATLDETQLSRKIGAETGGISTSFYTDLRHNSGVVASPDDALLYFMVRGKAVSDKVPIMTDLITDMLKNSKLDNKKRAVEMLKESKARKESSVLSSGHTFGATRLAAKFSFLGYLAEVTGGITSVRLAGDLLAEAENNWPAVQKRLERIRDSVVKRGATLINLTGDKALLESAMPTVEQFIKNLPEASVKQTSMLSAFSKDKLVPKVNEGFVMPSQVNYVVKGGQLVQPKEPVSGAYSVVSRYLSTGEG